MYFLLFQSDPPELLLGLDGASSGLKTRRVLPENTGYVLISCKIVLIFN